MFVEPTKLDFLPCRKSFAFLNLAELNSSYRICISHRQCRPALSLAAPEYLKIIVDPDITIARIKTTQPRTLCIVFIKAIPQQTPAAARLHKAPMRRSSKDSAISLVD